MASEILGNVRGPAGATGSQGPVGPSGWSVDYRFEAYLSSEGEDRLLQKFVGYVGGTGTPPSNTNIGKYLTSDLGFTSNKELAANFLPEGGGSLIIDENTLVAENQVEAENLGIPNWEVFRNSIGAIFAKLPSGTAITPNAPSNGVVNNNNKTFAFTLSPGYTLAQHEAQYRITGGNFTVYSTATNPLQLPDENIAIGDVRVRVKAIGINNPSSPLTNSTAYTKSSIELPVITVQPTEKLINAGDALVLLIEATGGSLSYQWYKTNAIIIGAITSTLTITSSNSSDTGLYKCRVSNTSGHVDSEEVLVTVYDSSIVGVLYNKSEWDDLSDFIVNKAENTEWKVLDNKLTVYPILLENTPSQDHLWYNLLDFLEFKSVKPNNDQTLSIIIDYNSMLYTSPNYPEGLIQNSRGGLALRMPSVNDITAQFNRFIYAYERAKIETPTETEYYLDTRSNFEVPNESEKINNVNLLSVNRRLTILFNEDGAKAYTFEDLTNTTSVIVTETLSQSPFNGFYVQLAYQGPSAYIWGSAKNIINKITITSLMPKNPYVLSIGDSKTTNPVDGSFNKRYPNKLAEKTNQNVLAYGGGSNRTRDLITISEYLVENNISPQIITLNAGRNDLAFAVSDPTWKANYIELVDMLKGLNPDAIFIHILPIKETEGGGWVDQARLKSWIISEYSSDLLFDIDNYGWNSVTMVSDGIHPNDIGTTLIADGLNDFINNI